MARLSFILAHGKVLVLRKDKGVTSGIFNLVFTSNTYLHIIANGSYKF